MVVISTASSLGEEATEAYRQLFEGLGIGRVTGLRPEERVDADDPAAARQLADATGVFLTGGNQSRLTQVVAGTRLGDALANAHDRGAVLAGTSAGASAMASHMVAYGTPGATPKNRMVQLSAGLGIIDGVVIDQHFEQRGRIGRLLALVAQSPSLLGIGIDEDTCAVVSADRTLHVLGKGAVTIVDGRHVKTDAYRGKGYKPLMVSGAILHSLPVRHLVRPAPTRAHRGTVGRPGRAGGVVVAWPRSARPPRPRRPIGSGRSAARPTASPPARPT